MTSPFASICEECGDDSQSKPCSCGRWLCPDHRAEHKDFGHSTIFTPEQREQMDATVYALSQYPERIDAYEDGHTRLTLLRRHDENCPVELTGGPCGNLQRCYRYRMVIEVKFGLDARGAVVWKYPETIAEWTHAATSFAQHTGRIDPFGRLKP